MATKLRFALPVLASFLFISFIGASRATLGATFCSFVSLRGGALVSCTDDSECNLWDGGLEESCQLGNSYCQGDYDIWGWLTLCDPNQDPFATNPTCYFEDYLWDGGPCVTEICGNGSVDPREECDDGGIISGDGCSAECRIESCGDGIVNSVTEECDDGDVEDTRNGCTNECTRNDECGNGIVEELYESCDTGDAIGSVGESCLACEFNCDPASNPNINYDSATNTWHVIPTGSNDTFNLQCAFDQGTNNPGSTIKLEGADYFLTTTVEVSGFEGTFSGVNPRLSVDPSDSSVLIDNSNTTGFTRISSKAPFEPKIDAYFFFFESAKDVTVSDMSLDSAVPTAFTWPHHDNPVKYYQGLIRFNRVEGDLVTSNVEFDGNIDWDFELGNPDNLYIERPVSHNYGIMWQCYDTEIPTHIMVKNSSFNSSINGSWFLGEGCEITFDHNHVSNLQWWLLQNHWLHNSKMTFTDNYTELAGLLEHRGGHDSNILIENNHVKTGSPAWNKPYYSNVTALQFANWSGQGVINNSVVVRNNTITRSDKTRGSILIRDGDFTNYISVENNTFDDSNFTGRDYASNVIYNSSVHISYRKNKFDCESPNSLTEFGCNDHAPLFDLYPDVQNVTLVKNDYLRSGRSGYEVTPTGQISRWGAIFIDEPLQFENCAERVCDDEQDNDGDGLIDNEDQSLNNTIDENKWPPSQGPTTCNMILDFTDNASTEEYDGWNNLVGWKPCANRLRREAHSASRMNADMWEEHELSLSGKLGGRGMNAISSYELQCDNQIDDDQDGAVDCDDVDCDTSQVCNYCGDGIVKELEWCDDGVNDGSYNTCNANCSAPGDTYCGDGLTQEIEGEACDQGLACSLWWRYQLADENGALYEVPQRYLDADGNMCAIGAVCAYNDPEAGQPDTCLPLNKYCMSDFLVWGEYQNCIDDGDCQRTDVGGCVPELDLVGVIGGAGEVFALDACDEECQSR